jgi:hypothetical protein
MTEIIPTKERNGLRCNNLSYGATFAHTVMRGLVVAPLGQGRLQHSCADRSTRRSAPNPDYTPSASCCRAVYAHELTSRFHRPLKPPAKAVRRDPEAPTAPPAPLPL